MTEPTPAMDLRTLDEAAAMVRKSPAQMRWMRHCGTGPKSARLGGRIMYRAADIESWVDEAFLATETT